MNHHEYWTQVHRIADELYEEHGNDWSLAQDELHEWIDSHQYIIYTHQATCVMTHTDNQDALFEHGFEPSTHSWGQMISQFAYFAMEADVIDRLNHLEEESAA